VKPYTLFHDRVVVALLDVVRRETALEIPLEHGTDRLLHTKVACLSLVCPSFNISQRLIIQQLNDPSSRFEFLNIPTSGTNLIVFIRLSCPAYYFMPNYGMSICDHLLRTSFGRFGHTNETPGINANQSLPGGAEASSAVFDRIRSQTIHSLQRRGYAVSLVLYYIRQFNADPLSLGTQASADMPIKNCPNR
jgi:hypothetical protein